MVKNRLNGSGRVARKHADFFPASQNRLGFRLRSPFPSVKELCPLSLQTAFSLLCLRLAMQSCVFLNHLAGAFRLYLRKKHGEGASLAQLAGDLNEAAVSLHDFFCYGKA